LATAASATSLERPLLQLGLLFGGLLGLAQRARFDHVAAKHVDSPGHRAELVLSVAAGDRHVGIAARKTVHHRGDGGQWTRHAAADQQRDQCGDGKNGDRPQNQVALRTRRRRLIFGGILDQFDHRDRLPGVIPDLAEIERGRMAIERGVATQTAAVEYALEFVLGGERIVTKGRCDICKGLAVETLHRQIDAEAPLGAIDELLVERNADIDDADAFSIAHDRRDAVNAE
jgi:hypothetical protein